MNAMTKAEVLAARPKVPDGDFDHPEHIGEFGGSGGAGTRVSRKTQKPRKKIAR